MLDELLYTQLDLAHNIVRGRPIAVPELQRELLICLDNIRGDEKSSTLRKDRVEVILDNTCAVLRLAKLGEGDLGVLLALLQILKCFILEHCKRKKKAEEKRERRRRRGPMTDEWSLVVLALLSTS